jgi:hypothetical protein
VSKISKKAKSSLEVGTLISRCQQDALTEQWPMPVTKDNDTETSQQMQDDYNENNERTQDNDDSKIPGSDVRFLLMWPCHQLKYIGMDRHQTSRRQMTPLTNVCILQQCLLSLIASDPTIAGDRSQVLNTQESTTDGHQVSASHSQAKSNNGERTYH